MHNIFFISVQLSAFESSLVAKLIAALVFEGTMTIITPAAVWPTIINLDLIDEIETNENE